MRRFCGRGLIAGAAGRAGREEWRNGRGTLCYTAAEVQRIADEPDARTRSAAVTGRASCLQGENRARSREDSFAVLSNL